MKNILIQHPIGWTSFKKEGDGQVSTLYIGDGSIELKIWLMSFTGTKVELQKMLKAKVENNFQVTTENNGYFIHEHVQWYADSYVVKAEKKYQSYFYTIIDNCSLVIRLMTKSSRLVLNFVQEVREIINLIDYSLLVTEHVFEKENNVYVVETPNNYRFDDKSSKSVATFISDTGYFVVNPNSRFSSLEELASNIVDCQNEPLSGCKLRLETHADYSVNSPKRLTYYVIHHGEITRTCTYLLQNLKNSTETILIFVSDDGFVKRDYTDFLKVERRYYNV